jgi:glucose-6-phosphate 1-dehydrogenase
VPFFLRTGKKLAKRASEIAVQLKDVPPILFNTNPAISHARRAVHPYSAGRRVLVRNQLEVPGPHVNIDPVKMDFHYKAEFRARRLKPTSACCST